MSKSKKEYKKKRNFTPLIVISAILLIFLLAYIIGAATKQEKVFGDDRIDLHFFHLSTCPACHRQISFHKKLKEMYPNLNIIEYEIKQPQTRKVLEEFAKNHSQIKLDEFSTPTTIIGKKLNIGFGDAESSGKILIEMIEEEITRINSSWNSNKIRTKDLRNQ